VLKQALPRLRVAADWRADPARSETEARALRLAGEVLGAEVVPAVRLLDREAHVVAMDAAPPQMQNLKALLLRGVVPREALARAGALLGRLQAATRDDPAAAAAFADLTAFRQLRLDAYHGEVARRHPHLATLVARQAEALTARRVCLVHGDWSPKNLLVGFGDRVLALDFEVAHHGARAFDPAFFLNHLLLKAVHLPGQAARLADGAAAFWDAYVSTSGWGDPEALETEVVGQLGVLLLARVDGKSPVEYLTEPERDRVRALGQRVLRAGLGDLGAVWESVLG